MHLLFFLLACGGDKAASTDSTPPGTTPPTTTGTPSPALPLTRLATWTGLDPDGGLGRSVDCGPGASGLEVAMGAPTVVERYYSKKYYTSTGGLETPSRVSVVPADGTGASVLGASDTVVLGEPGIGMGDAVALVPDQDGDGSPELYASLSGYGVDPDWFVALRVADPDAVELPLDQATGWIGTGALGSGVAVVALDDLGGDGAPDVGIGTAGEVLVLPGALVGADPSAAGALRIAAPAPSTFFGGSIATGDLDGDGASELLIGGDAGVWVYTGAGALLRSFELAGAGAFGARVRLGELGGDGSLDLILHDPRGDTWIWFGPLLAAGADPDLTIPRAEGQRWSGGEALAADLDGDGHPDLVVSDPRCHPFNSTWCDTPEPGQARAWAGPMSAGTLDPEAPTWSWTGPEALDGSGAAMDACDSDGDGRDELFLGAPGTGAQGSTWGFGRGAVHRVGL